MRLCLINPSNPLVSIVRIKESRWNRFRVWKPLSLMVLAGLTPPEWEITIVDENLGVPDQPAMPRPDLVGITAFTSQANRTYDVAAHFRCLGVPVVMGGIHATMCLDEAMERVDQVVTREAERVWPQVLEDSRHGCLKRHYDGGFAEIDRVPPARHDLLTGGYAIRLRNHILCGFEHAAKDPDAQSRRCRLTYTIVGGGPTGVEYAGGLAELLRGPLQRDFPKLDFHDARVLLIEGAERLLLSLPPRLGRYALHRLQNMGVEVRLKTVVDRVEAGEVHLKDGASIATETTIWTAGVRGEPAATAWGLPTDRGGRVPVEPTLEVPGLPGVYVIGDLAHSEEKGATLPMVAPVATQQGTTAARNIQRHEAGKPPLAFHYRDRGMMAMIGRNAAVAHIGGLAFTGFVAWVGWLGVHLIKLIGFRNRLFVLMNWAWDYFLFERMVRLILPATSCREVWWGRPGTGRVWARQQGDPANPR